MKMNIKQLYAAATRPPARNLIPHYVGAFDKSEIPVAPGRSHVSTIKYVVDKQQDGYHTRKIRV
jgi:hypothetical protein